MTKLTKRHFDRAVKQNWSTRTCPLAQHAKDNGIWDKRRNEIKMDKNGSYVAPYHLGSVAQKIMHVFDAHFGRPGDETKPELRELRSQLPISLT